MRLVVFNDIPIGETCFEISQKRKNEKQVFYTCTNLITGYEVLFYVQNCKFYKIEHIKIKNN